MSDVFLDFRAGGTGLGIGRLCTEDHTIQTDKIVQIFSGRNGDSNVGADLAFCNVSTENQRIGWSGGSPASDNLLLLHRFTQSSSGNSGDLMRVKTDNSCYYNFTNNYFANNIMFYTDADTTTSTNEGIIKYNGSEAYLYFHNPNSNSHNLGCYHTNVGTVWRYAASIQQLQLKAGYGVISDRRSKYAFNEFTNWDNYYNFFMSLKPQTFKYNNDMREETFIGMVAQDVADSIVENGLNNEKLSVVKCSENDNMEDGREYSLAYQEFISLNIKMIQKQEKEILELKEIIEEQQRLIEELLQEEI